MTQIDQTPKIEAPEKAGRSDGANESEQSGCVLLFLGSERSGTTFVQETLNKFYPVSQGNESQWVISAWHKALSQKIKTVADQERFIKAVFADWYFANKANYHQVYFDYSQFIQSEPFNFPRFVEQVFRHIANVEQNQWVLNKTCMFCEHMDIVDEVFRRPKVINLVRDGRDVGLSLIKTKAWGPIGAYGAARWWANRVDKIQQYAAEHMQDRYLELHYEELTSDPAATYERIARFYGIFEEERHAKLVESVRIKAGNSEKWRNEFSKADIELFERVAGDSLVRNGYKLANESPRPLPGWRHTLHRLNESVFSRVGFYPLWFRGLRLVNRLIGMSPTLQQKFYRSSFFSRHFNWNAKMGIEQKEKE